MSSPPEGSRFPSCSTRWKLGAVPVIGLTGGIGSGKSQVAAFLGERGAVVIDADAVGHQVLLQPEVQRQIVARFGIEVLRPGEDESPQGARVDRRALGAIVFADRVALRDLEAILHPRMRRQFEAIIGREVERGQAPAIVLDAAILLEAGWDGLCDLVVFVDAPYPVRLNRVARSRAWTAEVLEARERAQWPADIKKKRADLRLCNKAGLESLKQNVDHLFDECVRPILPPRTDSNPRVDGGPATHGRSSSHQPAGFSQDGSVTQRAPS